MNDLNDLLRALITVIVRYHQSKSTKPKITAEWVDVKAGDASTQGFMVESLPPTIDDLMEQTTTERTQSLLIYINEATQSVKTRRPLLLYIQHIIQLLGECEQSQDQDTCTFEQVLQYKNVRPCVATLLSDLKRLYTISIKVTYDNHAITLDSYYKFPLSKSDIATLIQELIFSPLSIALTTDEETLQMEVDNLFLKQEKRITDKMTEKMNQILKKNAELEQANQSLMTQLKNQPTPTMPATPVIIRQPTAKLPINTKSATKQASTGELLFGSIWGKINQPQHESYEYQPLSTKEVNTNEFDFFSMHY